MSREDQYVSVLYTFFTYPIDNSLLSLEHLSSPPATLPHTPTTLLLYTHHSPHTPPLNPSPYHSVLYIHENLSSVHNSINTNFLHTTIPFFHVFLKIFAHLLSFSQSLGQYIEPCCSTEICPLQKIVPPLSLRKFGISILDLGHTHFFSCTR